MSSLERPVLRLPDDIGEIIEFIHPMSDRDFTAGIRDRISPNGIRRGLSSLCLRMQALGSEVDPEYSGVVDIFVLSSEVSELGFTVMCNIYGSSIENALELTLSDRGMVVDLAIFPRHEIGNTLGYLGFPRPEVV